MTEWMTFHPWMTFAVLLLLVGSINFTFTIPLGTQHDDTPAPPPPSDLVMTPDQAREHMLTSRQRSARAVDQEIETFLEVGDERNVILMSLDGADETSMIAELLEYKGLGWNVEFYRGCAAISLPEVLS
jgi:hypothetical protein